MSSDLILHRLRVFLLAFSGVLWVGTVIELWLAGHTAELTQLIPFGLCGLGVAVVVAALLWPRRATLLILRGCMGLVMFGSGFGMYEHLEGNFALQMEIQPKATFLGNLLAAFSGADPLLAPGILAVAAVLAVVATYAHPALAKK